jgi:hypothetical protein
MSTKLTRASVNLRSAKLHLEEAEELVAAAGANDVKTDIDKALSRVDRVIERIGRQGGIASV